MSRAYVAQGPLVVPRVARGVAIEEHVRAAAAIPHEIMASAGNQRLDVGHRLMEQDEFAVDDDTRGLPRLPHVSLRIRLAKAIDQRRASENSWEHGC